MKKIAVITGASSGFGKEFVKQIDKLHLDEIWAIARDKGKFDLLAKEISTPFKFYCLDLTKQESIKQYKQLLDKEKPDITWLVNCAGFGKFGRYDEIPLEESVNMTELNCIALVKMTELSLPYMHEGGRIVQIASVAGYQPIPYMAIYAATKAYVVSYSRALNVELKPRKISVTCVCPFWSATNFFNRAKITKQEVVTKYVAMYQPQDVVKTAMKHALKRKEISIHGFKARNQVRLVKLLPHKLVMKIWCKQQKMQRKYK